MRIKFEQTSYLETIKAIGLYRDDTEIGEHANKRLRFKYGKATRQEFNARYSAEGWLGRKVIALPAAIWSGVVKTIYLLAKAILVRILKVFPAHKKYAQSQCFYMRRNFQESFGWLVSLFNDRCGQYHIQESGFHKSCYDCYLVDGTQHRLLSSNDDEETIWLEPQRRLLSPSTPLDSSWPRSHNAILIDDLNLSAKIDDDDATLDRKFQAIQNSHGKNQEHYFVQLADVHLQKGNLDKAHTAITKLYSNRNIQTKNAFLAKLAEAHFRNGNLDLAYKTIAEIQTDTLAKNTLLVKLTEAFLINGDLRQAGTTITEISDDDKTVEFFLFKIAETYFARGDRKEAIATIRGVRENIQAKNDFITKIENSIVEEAALHYENNDLDQAFTTIMELEKDAQMKEFYLVKIAKAHFRQGHSDRACEALKKLPHDIETKKSLVSEIVDTESPDKAIKAILTLTEMSNRMPLFSQLAQSHFSKNDEATVLTIIKEVLSYGVSEKAIERGEMIFFVEGYVPKGIEFFDSLAKKCFNDTREDFSKNNPTSALKKIIEKATEDSTLQAFYAFTSQ